MWIWAIGVTILIFGQMSHRCDCRRACLPLWGKTHNQPIWWLGWAGYCLAAGVQALIEDKPFWVAFCAGFLVLYVFMYVKHESGKIKRRLKRLAGRVVINRHGRLAVVSD